MPNTTYDNPHSAMAPQNRLQADNDNVSHAASEPAGERRKGNYKKYGLKDYNDMKSTAANTKLGGLGANIGSEKWEAANKKKEIAR